MSTVTTVGDRVKLKHDLIGTIRFIGEIDGKKGVYYGVELEEAKGKNKGIVGKVSYFKCKSKYGVFVKHASIIKTNSKNNPKTPRITIGDKVTYIKGKSDGVIRYIGTPFALHKSGIFYGIELQRPKGTNNGGIKGVKYFKCKSKHGEFLQAHEFVYHEHKLIKTIPAAKPHKIGNESKKKNTSKKKKKEKSVNTSVKAKKIASENKISGNTTLEKGANKKKAINKHIKTENEEKTSVEEKVHKKEVNQRQIKEKEAVQNIVDDDKDTEHEAKISVEEVINETIIKTEQHVQNNVDEHKHTDMDTNAFVNNDTNIFEMMDHAMKQLKALMVTKDTEIESLKQKYQALQRKNKEEMTHMKLLSDKIQCLEQDAVNKDTDKTSRKTIDTEIQEMQQKNKKELDHVKLLLDEQKSINNTLMDKIQSLEKDAAKMETKHTEDTISKNRKRHKNEIKPHQNDNVVNSEPSTKVKVVEDKKIIKVRVPENEAADVPHTKRQNDKPDIDPYDKTVDKIKERTYLVSGYIHNQQKSLGANIAIPSRIMHVCDKYCYFGTILKQTDSEYIAVTEGSTRVRSFGVDDVSVCCVSAEAFTEGTHICAVECINCPKERSASFCGVGHAIGVASCYDADCEFDNLQDAVYYDGYWGIIMDPIFKVEQKKTKWSKGDTIKFKLDCSKWKITFYKNDEEIGTYGIRKKKRYYLVIQLSSIKGCDFKIVQYQ